MPVPVKAVPDPWRPYMDGRLWEFTEEEIRELPRWQPMMSYEDSAPMGMRKMVWMVGRMYYVRFYDPAKISEPYASGDYVSYLAGWK